MQKLSFQAKQLKNSAKSTRLTQEPQSSRPAGGLTPSFRGKEDGQRLPIQLSGNNRSLRAIGRCQLREITLRYSGLEALN